MSEYTKGDWTARIQGEEQPSFQSSDHLRAAITAGWKVVAYLPELGREDTNTELEANAHLIAAAPALLEALEAWVKAYTCTPAEQFSAREMRLELCRIAEAAMAAARGTDEAGQASEEAGL